MHTQEAWRTTKGEGDHRRRPRHRRRRPAPRPGRATSSPARTWSASERPAATAPGPGTAPPWRASSPATDTAPATPTASWASPPRPRSSPSASSSKTATPPARKARNTRGNALAEGIRWAADHGADVINLSLGDDSASAHPEPAEDEAVQYALKKGAVVVASAGNGGEKGDHISYPAAYPGVIAATAVDRYGTRASFSTRRWYATVSAPGVDVVIADPDEQVLRGLGHERRLRLRLRRGRPHQGGPPGPVPGPDQAAPGGHGPQRPHRRPRRLPRLRLRRPRGRHQGGRPAQARGPAGRRYGQEYFGAGPDTAEDDTDTAGWAGPLAGGLGAVLLVAAVVLWRGRRRAPAHLDRRREQPERPDSRPYGSLVPIAVADGRGRDRRRRSCPGTPSTAAFAAASTSEIPFVFVVVPFDSTATR